MGPIKYRQTARILVVGLILIGCGGEASTDPIDDASDRDEAAYVANSASGGSVSVISTESNTVRATVPVGVAPVAVAITADGSLAYVANANSNSVSVIATATNTVVSTVSLLAGSGAPRGVAVTPNGTSVYATDDRRLTVIDRSTSSVVTTVVLGRGPWGVAIAPSGSLAYVANNDGFHLSVIETTNHTVVDSIPILLGASAIALTPEGAQTAQRQSQGARPAAVVDPRAASPGARDGVAGASGGAQDGRRPAHREAIELGRLHEDGRGGLADLDASANTARRGR